MHCCRVSEIVPGFHEFFFFSLYFTDIYFYVVVTQSIINHPIVSLTLFVYILDKFTHCEVLFV